LHSFAGTRRSQCRRRSLTLLGCRTLCRDQHYMTFLLIWRASTGLTPLRCCTAWTLSSRPSLTPPMSCGFWFARSQYSVCIRLVVAYYGTLFLRLVVAVMQAGFGMLESGSVQEKNMRSILFKVRILSLCFVFPTRRDPFCRTFLTSASLDSYSLYSGMG
jgi:hypothetical protein